MERKIGIMADSLRMPFRQAVLEAKKMRADGVQMYAVSGEICPESLTQKDRSAIRSFLKEEEMVLSALCGDLGGHGFAVQADNPRKIRYSKEIVDLALDLGTNIVTTHIGVIPEDTACEQYQIMREACNELAEYAVEAGARFAVETGPEKAAVLKGFLDSLDHPGIAVNLDPANFVMVTGQDPAEAVMLLKDYIVHTHVKDGIMVHRTDPKIIYEYFAQGGIEDFHLEEYFKEVPLGQGQVNFKEYFNALERIGYQGFYTIEREVGSNPYADIQTALMFLEEHFR